jgi:putative transposase
LNDSFSTVRDFRPSGNVIDCLPKRLHSRAKGLLTEIIEAPTRKDARAALEVFREQYGAKYPKALAKLDRDWTPLTAFYDYPAEHWRHLRTTDESVNRPRLSSDSTGCACGGARVAV